MAGTTTLQTLVATALFLRFFGCDATAQTSPLPVGLNTARSDPYYFTGRILADFGYAPARSYQATGTVIRPHSVITCAHILYDESYGWAYNLAFEHGLYANTFLKLSYPNAKFILGGYQETAGAYGGSSVRAFARDLGGLSFRGFPASGGYAGWLANPELLLNSTYTMSLGYGTESRNGRYLMRSAPTLAYGKFFGAYYGNYSYFIETGMSGGPVFAYTGGGWYVVAVNLSGFSRGTGVRVFNNGAANFINTYLP